MRNIIADLSLRPGKRACGSPQIQLSDISARIDTAFMAYQFKPGHVALINVLLTARRRRRFRYGIWFQL